MQELPSGTSSADRGTNAVDFAPAHARAVDLPWGPDSTLGLELPPEFRQFELSSFWPDLEGPVGDYPTALERALDAPVESPQLEHQVKAGSTVALVVDDPSRWTPVRAALPITLRRLHAAGVRSDDVTISVGVGRHQAVDCAAMSRRLGAEIAAAYQCFSPPVDDLTAYDNLGTTARGVPVLVFRPVARADLRILIGSVLPHLQAGFGGGYKLIFPGTSHRTTLGALHRQGLIGGGDAGSLLGGDGAGNPMRQAIQQAAKLLGRCISISHLIGGPAQVFEVIVGRPESVQELLAGDVRRRFQAQAAEQADIVVAGNHPWPGDPMQSFKVLLHHRAACKPGGVLVGFFWTDPDEIERSFPAFRPAVDRGHGRDRRLGDSQPGPASPARPVGQGLFCRLHAALGSRAGRRSHSSGVLTSTSRPNWPSPWPSPPLCRSTGNLAGCAPGGNNVSLAFPANSHLSAGRADLCAAVCSRSEVRRTSSSAMVTTSVQDAWRIHQYGSGTRAQA